MILCSSPITNIPMDEPSGACISPGCTQ
jgi:hypothetical protein